MQPVVAVLGAPLGQDALGPVDVGRQHAVGDEGQERTGHDAEFVEEQAAGDVVGVQRVLHPAAGADANAGAVDLDSAQIEGGHGAAAAEGKVHLLAQVGTDDGDVAQVRGQQRYVPQSQEAVEGQARDHVRQVAARKIVVDRGAFAGQAGVTRPQHEVFQPQETRVVSHFALRPFQDQPALFPSG